MVAFVVASVVVVVLLAVVVELAAIVAAVVVDVAIVVVVDGGLVVVLVVLAIVVVHVIKGVVGVVASVTTILNTDESLLRFFSVFVALMLLARTSTLSGHAGFVVCSRNAPVVRIFVDLLLMWMPALRSTLFISSSRISSRPARSFFGGGLADALSLPIPGSRGGKAENACSGG